MISAFVLKIIALISMTLDHLSYLIYGGFSNLTYIGRTAFPIFAFQISEGYTHTRNLKKYLLRLFVFALISQIPFMLFLSIFTDEFELNVFFTLFLGLIAIVVFDRLYKLECKNRYGHYLNVLLGVICVAVFAAICEIGRCDYGYYGVLIIFIFYLFKEKKLLMNFSFILCTSIYFIIRYYKYFVYVQYLERCFLLIAFTYLPLVFINLYNNKKGRNIKYLLYFYYPAHLFVIYLLHTIN